MSWLSSAIKKIKKIQPGKVIVAAVKSAGVALPIVGSVVGGIQGAWDEAKKQFTTAKDAPGGGVVTNVNQAAQDVSKYGLWLMVGLGVVLLLLVMKK